MIEITEDDLLHELAAAMLATHKQPGEVTMADLMRATGLKRDACRVYLDAMVAAGKLEVRTINEGGKSCKAYKRAG